MAALEITRVSAIPGLHVAPTLDDLKTSATCWNSLPESLEQPDAPVQHLSKLAELFGRHGVQKRFAMHLIHRHDIMKGGQVMMGSNLESLTGSWTRPMKIQDLDPSDMHGHIFKLTPNGLFQAYEYRKGPPVDLDVGSEFFSGLSNYLYENQLTDVLGLEVIETEEPLIEFDLGDNGTVMLKEDQANYGKAFKETGFFYHKAEDGVRQLKGNTTHAETVTPGVHKVFVDGKLTNEAGLVKALHELGLIEM